MDEFSFSKWIDDEMKKQHISGNKLSKMTGITAAAISHYRNCRRFPTIVTVTDILNALGKRIVIVDKETPPNDHTL